MTDATSRKPVLSTAVEELIKNRPTVTDRDVKAATWICFFAWTFAVYDFVLFGSLLPRLAESHGWSGSYATGVNTWVTIGTAIVALCVGPMVDKLGRRKGIMIAVIGAALMSAVTALAGWLIGIIAGLGVIFLILIRSLAGLGYAEQTINATYLNEMFAETHSSPEKARRRGLVYSVVQSGYSIGSVLAAGSIYLLFPIGGWALCFIVGAFPALFMVWAARYLKESPQYIMRQQAERLIKDGREEEAHAFASAIGFSLHDRSAPIVSAFKKESLRATVVLGLSFFLIWFGALTFGILGTSLLSAPDGKNIAFDNAIVVLIVSNLSAWLGFLCFGWLGDMMGRRNAIAIGWMLSGAAFTVMLNAPDGGFAIIVALYSVGLFFLWGPFASLLFFSGESFSAHVRATGTSIIAAVGQMGAVAAGALITYSLASGAGWVHTATVWGAAPTFIAGLLILCARNIPPHTVQSS